MSNEILPIRDRALTSDEVEALRLMLSTFRDGSGMVKKPWGTMPGFRDFERATAAITNGQAREDKGIYDVWVPTNTLPYGISCKMASAQSVSNKSSFMELSNSSAKFNNAVTAAGLKRLDEVGAEPDKVGPVVVDLVMSWHSEVDSEVDRVGSKYFVLDHDTAWRNFRLHCFPLDLRIADPRVDVDWRVEGKALNGYIDDHGRRHRVWQWYAFSGGQLKYYPLLDWAEWSSSVFQLEEAPVMSLRDRAIEYFGDMWPAPVTSEEQITV